MSTAATSLPETDSTRRCAHYILSGATLWNDTSSLSIEVRDGLITSIVTADHQPPDRGQDCQQIDATGLVLMPGFTDLYGRLRQPGSSRMGTIDSESRAALKAGITRILAAPDTRPCSDSVATIEQVLNLSLASDGAQVLPMAALTRDLAGEQLAELATLKQAGCVAAGQADHPIANAQVLYNAFEYAASFDLPLVMTARDAALGANGCVHSGAQASRMGLTSVPVSAETIALARYLEIAREVGVKLHISRVSSARAVDLVDHARQAGLALTADVGLQHLLFTEADTSGYDSRYHTAVPLRAESDRQALREAVATGVIDAICSDHAPLDVDARLAPFASCAPGISSYDYQFPQLVSLVERGVLSWGRAIDGVAIAPSRILGLTPPSLSEGATANFLLCDLHADTNPSATNMVSRGHNTPLLDANGAASDVGDGLKGAVRTVFRGASITSVS